MVGISGKVIICSECNWAVKGLAKDAGVDTRLISFQDVLDCIKAHPNRSHEVRPDDKIDAAIKRIRERH